jgi:hypothetical protein
MQNSAYLAIDRRKKAATDSGLERFVPGDAVGGAATRLLSQQPGDFRQGVACLHKALALFVYINYYLFTLLINGKEIK